MNHATVGKIVAISMVAALAIAGVSILSSPKVLAISLKIDGYNMGTSNGTASLQGPNGLDFDTGGQPPSGNQSTSSSPPR
jgi:hypothetical protein